MRSSLAIPLALSLAACAPEPQPRGNPEVLSATDGLTQARKYVLDRAQVVVVKESHIHLPGDASAATDTPSIEVSRAPKEAEATAPSSDLYRCGFLWLRNCQDTVEDTPACTPAQEAELRILRDKETKTLGSGATHPAIQALWAGEQAQNENLKQVEWENVSGVSDAKDRCTDLRSYLDYTDGKNYSYGFTLDKDRLALSPLMFEGAETAPLCDRVGALVTMEYCRTSGDCDVTVKTPLPGVYEVTPNTLRDLVSRSCAAPATTLEEESAALAKAFKTSGPFTLKDDEIHTKGTGPIKDHSVTGDLTLGADGTLLVTKETSATVDLGDRKKLTLKFSEDSAPDDNESATLSEGTGGKTLRPYGVNSTDFDWYTCPDGSDTCNPRQVYTLKAKTWDWTGPVDQATN